MPNMTESEVFDKFAQIVAKSLRIDASQIAPDTHLTDLGAESLDLIEITMETETQFHIFLPDKSVLETAVEVFGPGILEKDGYLTEEGKRFLLRRMPGADAQAFEGRRAGLRRRSGRERPAVLFFESRHLGADDPGPGAVHARGMRGVWRIYGAVHGLPHEMLQVRPGDYVALRRRAKPRMGPRVLR